MSSQAYYKHGNSQLRRLAEEAFCVEFIKRIRQKDRGIGGGKLWKMYKKEFGEEHSVGYNRFYDIIERYNLKVRKRKRRAKTTDSDHDLPLYPNLVKELIPLRPNQLWVSDITYMVVYLNAQTGEYNFCYLSLVTDYYTKEVIGWCVGETLEAKFAIEARYEDIRMLSIVRNTGMFILYCICMVYAYQRLPYRLMPSWIHIMLISRSVMGPAIGAAIYGAGMQHYQQQFIHSLSAMSGNLRMVNLQAMLLAVKEMAGWTLWACLAIVDGLRQRRTRFGMEYFVSQKSLK